MITSSYFNRLLEILPTEMRLVRQAKAGNVSSFVELSEPFVRHVYRYIHFLAPNNRVAEALTLQVFFKAWERLDHYQIFDTSFPMWLYSIARKQLEDHSRSHKNNIPDNPISLAARGDEFKQELQSVRDAIRSLSADQQQAVVLRFIVCMPEKDIAHFMSKSKQNIRNLQVAGLCSLASRLEKTEDITVTTHVRRILENCLAEISTGASTLDDCLLRYFKTAPQLEPLLKTALLLQLGSGVTPISTFNVYVHDALVQYLRIRPRRAAVAINPVIQRTAIAFAILTAAFVVTGTASAQAAMPGEPLYPWKRTSEMVWHALTPNSTATDLALAERRLNEWITVEGDPALRDSAMKDYQEALSDLKSADDEEDRAMVASALQSQQEALTHAGLVSPALDEYLSEVSELLPAAVPTQVTPLMITTTATPTVVAPVAAPTDVATEDCAPKCQSNNGNNSNNGNANGAANGNAGGNSNGGNNAGGIGNGAGGSNAGGNGNNDGDNGGGNDDSTNNGNGGDKGNGGK
jgi:RNA polymerase sigma factor (sigma-70 family)